MSSQPTFRGVIVGVANKTVAGKIIGIHGTAGTLHFSHWLRVDGTATTFAINRELRVSRVIAENRRFARQEFPASFEAEIVEIHGDAEHLRPTATVSAVLADEHCSENGPANAGGSDASADSRGALCAIAEWDDDGTIRLHSITRGCLRPHATYRVCGTETRITVGERCEIPLYLLEPPKFIGLSPIFSIGPLLAVKGNTGHPFIAKMVVTGIQGNKRDIRVAAIVEPVEPASLAIVPAHSQ